MNSWYRGFSLIEVLVATAVMSLGMLALFAAITYGVKANRHGELSGEATNLGREILALIRGRGWADDATKLPMLKDAPGVRKPVDAPPFQDDLNKYAGSIYQRNVRVERLAPLGSFEHDLASLKVTIFWVEGKRAQQLPLETYQRL